jgi:hypothetical protein
VDLVRCTNYSACVTHNFTPENSDLTEIFSIHRGLLEQKRL